MNLEKIALTTGNNQFKQWSKGENIFLPSPASLYLKSYLQQIQSQHPDQFICHEMAPFQLAKSLTSNANEDAFYVFDLKKTIERCELWNSSIPKVIPYYAVKVNPDPLIVQMLVNLGIGFDCATINEIRMVLSSGASSERIIFAHPCKPISSLKYANDHEVKMMTFDCISELQKMNQHVPEGEYILRLRVDDLMSGNPLGEKFGATLSEAQNIIDYAYSEKIKIKGFSFHVGSNCLSESAYEFALDDCLKIINWAKDKYDYSFDIVNLGGGWPGNNDEKFQNIAKKVNSKINEFPSHYKFIAEPGRFFATQTGISVMRVIGKKESHTLGRKIYNYYMGDGAWGTYSNSIYYGHDNKMLEMEGWNFKSFESENQTNEKFESILWGPTCDAGDRIGSGFFLPELKLGDCLYSQNMGSYTFNLKSNFNSVTAPSVHYSFHI